MFCNKRARYKYLTSSVRKVFQHSKYIKINWTNFMVFPFATLINFLILSNFHVGKEEMMKIWNDWSTFLYLERPGKKLMDFLFLLGHPRKFRIHRKFPRTLIFLSNKLKTHYNDIRFFKFNESNPNSACDFPNDKFYF
jgi:hypothetical protein